MESIASIPVTSLRRTPPGYRQPLWRWVVLPASAILQHHYGGVWISGDLQLAEDELRFLPTKLGAKFHRSPEAWTLPLGAITEVRCTRGMAMETIDVHHEDGVRRLKSVRSLAFVERLQEAVSAARAGVTASGI